MKRKAIETPVDHYAVNIAWSEEDEAFIARVPSMPGCIADGRTREEALKEANSAMKSWLECAVLHNDPIPEPDAVLDDIRRLLPIVNVSKLARAAGLNRDTLFTRIRRGTPLPKADAAKVRKALAELAVA